MPGKSRGLGQSPSMVPFHMTVSPTNLSGEPEFNGVLGCDYFSAYRKFMTDFDVRIQFCLAHLIRDVKFLVDFPDASVNATGPRSWTHCAICSIPFMTATQ